MMQSMRRRYPRCECRTGTGLSAFPEKNDLVSQRRMLRCGQFHHVAVWEEGLAAVEHAPLIRHVSPPCAALMAYVRDKYRTRSVAQGRRSSSRPSKSAADMMGTV